MKTLAQQPSLRFSRRLLLIFVLLIISASPARAEFENIDRLLNDGQAYIEIGEYQRAVDCLGRLLAASGDKTNEPKAMAFGYTVQAYGMWKTGDSSFKPTIKKYLQEAIKKDPNWRYPKKLFGKIFLQ